MECDGIIGRERERENRFSFIRVVLLKFLPPEGCTFTMNFLIVRLINRARVVSRVQIHICIVVDKHEGWTEYLKFGIIEYSEMVWPLSKQGGGKHRSRVYPFY